MKAWTLCSEYVSCLFLLMLSTMHHCIVGTLPEITKFWRKFLQSLCHCMWPLRRMSKCQKVNIELPSHFFQIPKAVFQRSKLVNLLSVSFKSFFLKPNSLYLRKIQMHFIPLAMIIKLEEESKTNWKFLLHNFVAI